jgi:tetratricopeptide (TPR) repeat protein
LLINEASVIDGHGEAPRALELLAEAHRLLTTAGAEDGPPANAIGLLTTHVNVAIGSAHGSAGNYEPAADAFQKAIEGTRRAFGDDHPRVVPLLANLGETYRRAAKHPESLAAYEEAARIAERSMGETPLLVRLWNRVGGLHFELRQLDEANAHFDRALALAEKVLPPDDKIILSVLTDRALTLSELGRREEALAAYDRVIAAHQRAKAPSHTWQTAVHNRAGTLRGLQRWDEAIAGFQDALRMLDDLPGQERDRLEALVGLGLTFLEAQRPAEAIAPLERARDDRTEGRNLALQRSSRWLLGRARVEARRDGARGRAEISAVRAELVAAGDDTRAAAELVDLDAWLASRGERIR